jgi:dTMP kinase
MAGRSLFISVEGIDGSGKSTQARLLAEALRAGGHAVTLTREPGGSPGAEEIRRLVLEGDPERWSPETEILLFTAARRDHLEKTIRPALERGEIVITDRFADSTRVYQGSMRDSFDTIPDFDPEADIDAVGGRRALIDHLHSLMIGTEPDLTLLIDIDPVLGLSRAVARKDNEQRFEDMGLAMQVRMRAAFLALADQFPTRILVIDGAHAPAVVAEAVANAVRRRLAAA